MKIAPSMMISGRYGQTGSWLHRLDPRAKIVATMLFLVAPFLVASFAGLIWLLLVVILIAIAARISLPLILKGLRPLLYILVFTVLVHGVKLAGGGEALMGMGPFELSYEGLITGLFYAGRLGLLVLGTSLLTLTTSPLSLIEGVHSLLSPLKRIRLPVGEISLMLTLALRFVPTIFDEAERLAKAQMSRGADFSDKDLIKRGRTYLSLMVPLIVGAFRRAGDLALAMDARGFQGAEGRSSFHELRWSRADSLFIGMTLVLLAATAGANGLLEGLAWV